MSSSSIVYLFSNTLCCMSLFGLSVLNMTTYVYKFAASKLEHTCHPYQDALLKSLKGLMGYILWGHIKALHMPGYTVNKHQWGFCPPPPLLPFTRIRVCCLITSIGLRRRLNTQIVPYAGIHAVHTLNMDLPGTSIIFLYTFKKAFSASLLRLLNASICTEKI